MDNLGYYYGYCERYDDDDYYEEEEQPEVYIGFEYEQPEGCCAAITLWGFPEYDVMSEDECFALKRDLKQALRDYYLCSLVMIQTIPAQKQTNKILRELGFRYTRWMEKPEHDNPENKLRLWWFEPDRKRDF